MAGASVRPAPLAPPNTKKTDGSAGDRVEPGRRKSRGWAVAWLARQLRHRPLWGASAPGADRWQDRVQDYVGGALAGAVVVLELHGVWHAVVRPMLAGG